MPVPLIAVASLLPAALNTSTWLDGGEAGAGFTPLGHAPFIAPPPREAAPSPAAARAVPPHAAPIAPSGPPSPFTGSGLAAETGVGSRPMSPVAGTTSSREVVTGRVMAQLSFSGRASRG